MLRSCHVQRCGEVDGVHRHGMDSAASIFFSAWASICASFPIPSGLWTAHLLRQTTKQQQLLLEITTHTQTKKTPGIITPTQPLPPPSQLLLLV